MPDPVTGIIVGGSAFASSALSSKGASEAADAQTDAAYQQLALQKHIYDEQTALLSPFVQAGTGGLAGLTALSTPEGQAQYLEDYYGGAQFASQSDAARNQQLAAAEATGGLMGTSTANQLARISPTLGAQALQQQQNTYGQLANIGLSGAGATAGYAGQYGAGASQALGGLGAAQAYGAAAPYQAFGAGIGQIGGLAAGSEILRPGSVSGLFSTSAPVVAAV